MSLTEVPVEAANVLHRNLTRHTRKLAEGLRDSAEGATTKAGARGTPHSGVDTWCPLLGKTDPCFANAEHSH